MESGNCLIEVWGRVHLDDFAIKALSTNNILNLSKTVSKKEKTNYAKWIRIMAVIILMIASPH